MRYRIVVYLQRPRALWEDRIDENDVTFEMFVPWLWLARYVARGNVGNTNRCGYQIFVGEKLIERQDGTAPCVEIP